MSDDESVYWLSYGGGVNSTALAVLLCQGELKKYEPWRLVFADTRDEKPETYDFIYGAFVPYLRRFGKVLEVVADREGVFDRWWRLGVVGSRTLRSCTDHAKITPISWHIRAHSRKARAIQMIGIDAGESHRARPARAGDPFDKLYPLVDLGIDRAGCEKIISAAGLQVPPKSGCWHCPFMRVGEIVQLALKDPCKFDRIVALEDRSIATQAPPDGAVRAQWGDKPARVWKERANGGPLFATLDGPMPCECFDGDR